MAFDLPDSWVWDFWFADDGERYHVFFLYASRALHDPDLRHARASIGHAVSDDLVDWTQVADALVRADAPAFDSVATWTGCVVRPEGGPWFLFYTGVEPGPGGEFVQRVATATSTDLTMWMRTPESPVVSADPRWYETLEDATWGDEHWRDPWVFPDPGGVGWHMLITARARVGDPDTRGVVGHATSPDLRSWTAAPPLSRVEPGGFGQLEVMQVATIDDRPVLIFSCLSAQASSARRNAQPRAAVWAAPAESVTGPFLIDRAYPLVDDDLYVGRLLQRRDDGAWLFFAFRNADAEGRFVGGITDPMPVRWEGDRLTVQRAPQ